MKPMKDFFKSEAAFIEFMLLYGSGEQRTDVLGITVKHYADKALAARWAGDLAAKITDDDARKALTKIYRRMIDDEKAGLPEKQDPAPVAAAMADTVGYADAHGAEALKARLEQMTVEELKQTIKVNDLDPLKQYTRTKKPERLREVILVVSCQRATKGDGFI